MTHDHPESDAATAHRLAHICRVLFFGEPFRLHLPGHRKRLRRELTDILRDHVAFPPAIMRVMRAYADGAIAAGRDIDWTVTTLYSPDEKEKITDHIRTHGFNSVQKLGDYRMPPLVFHPVGTDTKGRASEGEYSMVGNIVKIAPDLRSGSLEKLVTVAAHEDGHALIHQFRRNCFGLDYKMLEDNPAMEWRRFQHAAKKELAEEFYTICPEEAAVRRLASHVIGRMSQNRDDVTRVVQSEMAGYARHRAARDLTAILMAGG